MEGSSRASTSRVQRRTRISGLPGRGVWVVVRETTDIGCCSLVVVYGTDGGEILLQIKSA